MKARRLAIMALLEMCQRWFDLYQSDECHCQVQDNDPYNADLEVEDVAMHCDSLNLGSLLKALKNSRSSQILMQLTVSTKVYRASTRNCLIYRAQRSGEMALVTKIANSQRGWKLRLVASRRNPCLLECMTHISDT